AESNCRPACGMTPWPLMAFNGVKVFSATMYQHRAALGDRVTEWIAANQHIRVVDSVVTQSSDSEFHCLSITLFYQE
ncbi:MAG TPA: hypothetical protein VF334_16170, partial [Polyangia bacterium]